MYTIYLALLLFGNNQACHARVECRDGAQTCTVKVTSCPELTLPLCLNATVVTSRGRQPVLGCANKPNPKTADVDFP